LGELVHNAHDAGAKNCRIFTRLIDRQPHLIVDDDGSGMTHDELRNALMFGRVIDRQRAAGTNGKYGFGLKVR